MNTREAVDEIIDEEKRWGELVGQPQKKELDKLQEKLQIAEDNVVDLTEALRWIDELTRMILVTGFVQTDKRDQIALIRTKVKDALQALDYSNQIPF